MAKTVNKLTAMRVKKEKTPGWYPDGLGLYLQVSQSGSKSWVYRYQIDGIEHRHGLGSYSTITLDGARQGAQNCRTLREEGIDPIEYKKQFATLKALEANKGLTFKECALAYIESHKAGWKNRKHESQWRNTLETYAYPVIGGLAAQDVDAFAASARSLPPVP